VDHTTMLLSSTASSQVIPPTKVQAFSLLTNPFPSPTKTLLQICPFCITLQEFSPAQEATGST